MNNWNKPSDEKTLHIGFDDTDSINGRCTTHLSYLISNMLIKKFQVEFIDFPLLIRLNPNVPLKTRGNGAVCLRIESELPSVEVLELAAEELERSSRLGDPGTDPAIVLLGGAVPSDVVEFSEE